MIALDSNVVLRYLLADDEEQTPRAAAVIEARTHQDPGYVGHLVLAEIYWVLTRGRLKVSRRDALDAIDDLSTADGILVEHPSGVRFALAAGRRGADFADALIAHAAQRAGAHETVTFDEHASSQLGFRLL